MSYRMMKLNHLHKHYLYTWAWTLSLSKIKSTSFSCSPWCLYPSQQISDILIRRKRWRSAEIIIVEVASDQNEIINPSAKINNTLQAWYPPVITPLGGCKGISVRSWRSSTNSFIFSFKIQIELPAEKLISSLVEYKVYTDLKI